MSKIIYLTRVLIISVEFLIIVTSWLFNQYLLVSIEGLTAHFKINNDAYNYLIVIPVGIFMWMINEVTPILFPNEKVNAFLHKWNNLWKLKFHIYTGLLYSGISTMTCLLVWLFGDGSLPQSILLLATALAVQSSSAISFFIARVEISSILTRASE